MTHTCPGLCGQTISAVFTCPACSRLLPGELRAVINVTWWQRDWPAHSRALADGLHYLASHYHATPGRPRRTGHSGHDGWEPA